MPKNQEREKEKLLEKGFRATKNPVFCLQALKCPRKALCGQEVAYLREFLRDFGFTPAEPTRVYEDKLACVAMSENPVRRKYSRHIDFRGYFVRDLVALQVQKLVPLRTNLMVADALTKRAILSTKLPKVRGFKGILGPSRRNQGVFPG